ncbi:MAG: histidine kinase [Candidatus Nanopelagicales bacterium]
MIADAVRTLRAEPRPDGAPDRVARDWPLVGALVVAMVVESLLRPDMPWRPVGWLEIAVLAYALLHRRTEPLRMCLLAFGTLVVVDTVALVAGVVGPVSPYSAAFVLVLVYALYRWGSGREVILGSAAALVAAGVGFVRDRSGIGDVALGLVVLALPAALGAVVRFRAAARARDVEQARLREREQLARELHDTVAHHVSAMVVRAQAGRVLAATSPEAAVEALGIIESEGSRTLAEMRSMVGALRDRDAAQLAPRTGIADLAGLARDDAEPRVEVTTSGDLRVSPAVDAAVYRIAQESVTNALRHARRASLVLVQVDGGPDGVRVRVTDDGEHVAARGQDGFGIVGMTERATILGGTLDAGPGAARGWTVSALLPREAAR